MGTYAACLPDITVLSGWGRRPIFFAWRSELLEERTAGIQSHEDAPGGLPATILNLHVLRCCMNAAPAALERRGLEDRAGTSEPIHQIRCGHTLFDRR